MLSYSVVSRSLAPWIVTHWLLCPRNFPSKITWVGCHFLLQGIFPILGSNLCLLCLLQVTQETRVWSLRRSLPLALHGKPWNLWTPLKKLFVLNNFWILFHSWSMFLLFLLLMKYVPIHNCYHPAFEKCNDVLFLNTQNSIRISLNDNKEGT